MLSKVFFSDFKKGFDLIDHRILMEKLSTQYNLHWSLLRWVAPFLKGRAQVTRVGASVSAPLYLNGGIPQGTKLGPVLFAVMVNDLVQSWGARIKFVDDLTVLEVVPRNSPSLLNVVVDDIHAFAVNNNMRLNPRNCKSMTVDFLHYNSCVPRPVAVGGSDIEQVSTFKLLGVHLSENLTWAVHCDCRVKKANRRLYALRLLKKCKVPSADIVDIFCALIRSILEYAPPLSLLACLSIFLAISKTCKKGPFPSFGLVFCMRQHLTKLHYPLFLTLGQSRVLIF